MTAVLESPASANVSEEFVDAGWWPYFKEHINRDGVKFGKEAMERICQRANDRIDELGDYAPLVLHHTRDNDPDFTPEYVGLVGPFRLQKVGTKKPVWAIFGRERVRKSKLDALKEFPRRSVEYWADKDDPTNGYFDPISALPAAVTPELDLGIHYQADPDDPSRTLMRYQKVSRYEASPGGANTYIPDGIGERKDRYQADGSLSPGDLQQIIVALSPVIKQAVAEAVASSQPQGADPEHLLTPDKPAAEEGEFGATDLDDDSQADAMGEPDGDEFPEADAALEEPGEEAPGADETSGENLPADEEPSEKPAADGGEPDALDQLGQEFGKKLKGKKKPAKFAKEMPSDKISAAKARQILEDGEVQGHELTDAQRRMFGAAAHYEKMCQYEAADDMDGADLYWRELDDESKEHVRSFADTDEDEPRGQRMRERYMASPSTETGAKYMADTTHADLTRYQKENADLSKENARLKGELGEVRTKYQKAIDEKRQTATELQAVNDRVAKLEGDSRRAVRYSKLQDLQTHGYAFDLDAEMKDCDDLADAQFDKHCERIRTNYQKAPQTLGASGLRVVPSTKITSQRDREKEKLDRYSKRAEAAVYAARKTGGNLDFNGELKRLMEEDPEKIDAA